MNTTVVGEAQTSQTIVALSQATGAVKESYSTVFICPRVTNYVRNATGTNRFSSTNDSQNGTVVFISDDTDFPTAQITDLIMRAIVTNAGTTLGADELHVYTQAIS